MWDGVVNLSFKPACQEDDLSYGFLCGCDGVVDLSFKCACQAMLAEFKSQLKTYFFRQFLE